jgi:hypothetical protein
MFIDENGVPYDAKVQDCPKVFHEAAREGLMKWRWYAPRDGREKIKAQTIIVVRFRES